VRQSGRSGNREGIGNRGAVGLREVIGDHKFRFRIGEKKMADIQQLEDSIVSLSLLEARLWSRKLEERLGVSAAAAVAAPRQVAARSSGSG